MRQSLLYFSMLMLPASANADVELSFYGGLQSAQPSVVSVYDANDNDNSNDLVQWEGKSFSAPPYYGIRATIWSSSEFGYGLDFTHNKIYPKSLPPSYDRLEFTDGLNTLTVNAYRRWKNGIAGLTPYVGGGVGLAIPYVEVVRNVKNSETSTFEYQVTGPAVALIAGASYPINNKWSVFGEYKSTYSQNKADLDDGSTLETNIVTNAVNLGLSFRF